MNSGKLNKLKHDLSRFSSVQCSAVQFLNEVESLMVGAKRVENSYQVFYNKVR